MAHADETSDTRGYDAKYRISDVGLDLFLQDGFDKVPVDAIADAAGVSRRTVFRYFRTKQEIPFPDHAGRLELQRQILDSAAPQDDPFIIYKQSGRAIMADFIAKGGIVLKRFQLAQQETLIREREYIENAHYTHASRAFLAKHLTGEDRELRADVYSAAVNAVHRSVLRDWAQSDGQTDALQDLSEKSEWVLSLLHAEGSSAQPIAAGASDSMIVAVLPSTAENVRRINNLLNEA